MAGILNSLIWHVIQLLLMILEYSHPKMCQNYIVFSFRLECAELLIENHQGNHLFGIFILLLLQQHPIFLGFSETNLIFSNMQCNIKLFHKD